MGLEQRPVNQIGPLDIPVGLFDVNFRTVETITQGDALYVNASTYVGRARANASSTMHAIGFAREDAASGLPVGVRLRGSIESTNYNFSGFLGRFAYVSTGSAGGLQATPPASSGQIVQVAGVITGRQKIEISFGIAAQVGGAIF